MSATCTAPPPTWAALRAQAHSFAKAIRTDMRSLFHAGHDSTHRIRPQASCQAAILQIDQQGIVFNPIIQGLSRLDLDLLRCAVIGVVNVPCRFSVFVKWESAQRDEVNYMPSMLIMAESEVHESAR